MAKPGYQNGPGRRSTKPVIHQEQNLVVFISKQVFEMLLVFCDPKFVVHVVRSVAELACQSCIVVVRVVVALAGWVLKAAWDQT